MAEQSTMLVLGTMAPDFLLPDPYGKEISSHEFKGAPVLLIMFLCNHCPYVKHIRSGLAEFMKGVQSAGVAVIGISSNDVGQYPEDGPAAMAEEVRSAGYTFPYLYDEDQSAARAYRAACTPDFFLFDKDRKLAYRGQFDGSRPGNKIPVTGVDLRAAVEAVLAGRPVPADQKPSVGCGIKWKPEGALGAQAR